MTKTFTRLISENYNVIFGPVNEYVPIAWQQDVQQDILMAAWQAYPSFRGESKFSTWLYKIALHKCVEFRRRERARIARETAWSELDHEQQESRWDELRERMARIGSKERILLFQYYLYGVPASQLAARMGVTENHFRVLVHRLKQNICK